MKYLWIIIVLSLGLYACGSGFTEQNTAMKNATPEQFPTPIAYNDHLVGIQIKVVNALLKLSNAIKDNDPEALRTTYNNLVKTAEKANADISKLNCYWGDCEMRDAAQNLFRFYEEMAKNEYKELIDILLKGEGEITIKDLSRIDELTAALSNKEVQLDANFEKAQNNFAKKHGFPMIKNKIQDKIDNI